MRLKAEHRFRSLAGIVHRAQDDQLTVRRARQPFGIGERSVRERRSVEWDEQNVER
jgi:hypothetical protein